MWYQTTATGVVSQKIGRGRPGVGRLYATGQVGRPAPEGPTSRADIPPIGE